MVWLPVGEKNVKMCLFFSTEYTNVIDRQTEGQIPDDGMGLTYA